MIGTAITRDCASCVVDDAMQCRSCLAEQLLRAQAHGDEGEVVRLEYLIQLVDGVVTAVTATVSMH